MFCLKKIGESGVKCNSGEECAAALGVKLNRLLSDSAYFETSELQQTGSLILGVSLCPEWRLMKFSL